MDDSPGTLLGRAVLYDVPTTIHTPFGDYREVIRPGALTRALTDTQITAVRNHNVDALLGRVSAGSLLLFERRGGVDSKITLPPTELGRETATLVERGDLAGMSFAFASAGLKETWYDPAAAGDLPTAVIDEITRMFDVSPVTWPAYEGTTLQLQQQPSQELGPADRARESRMKELEARMARDRDAALYRAHSRHVYVRPSDADRNARWMEMELGWNLGRRCTRLPDVARTRRMGRVVRVIAR